MAVINPNVETDFFQRVTNLEAACFAGGINNGTETPAFQGTVQTVGTVYVGAADALAFPGLALLNRSGAVDAATLLAPVAGTDDWKALTIINIAAQANTVTCQTSGHILDGTGTPKTTITFGAHAGGCVKLRAYQGYWYLENAALNATLT